MRGLSTWSQTWGACLPPPHIHSCSFSFFCHQYPELLVASYNNNEDAPHEPDGVALVWNMKYKKATPEYVFHCQVHEAPLLLSPTPPHWWLLPWQAWSSANQPLFCTPLTLLLLLTLQPSCTLWVHRTGIHLHHIYPQTHVREVPEKNMRCRSWMESEHRRRIKCVGPGWLSCASKQGPCVQTS